MCGYPLSSKTKETKQTPKGEKYVRPFVLSQGEKNRGVRYQKHMYALEDHVPFAVFVCDEADSYRGPHLEIVGEQPAVKSANALCG